MQLKYKIMNKNNMRVYSVQHVTISTRISVLKQCSIYKFTNKCGFHCFKNYENNAN